MRYFISGSAPLSREIAEFFHACGILILEGYGLTETERGEFVNRPTKFAFGTVGVPMPGTEVKLAPEDGEILIKSPGVMQGYHNLPERPPRRSRPTAGCAPATSARSIAQRLLAHHRSQEGSDQDQRAASTSRRRRIEGKLKATCPYLSQVIVHGDKRNFVTALRHARRGGDR